MKIDLWTLSLQTVNVLILIWLLGRFLFRPVRDAILARQKAAEKLLADAQAAKDQAEADVAALRARNDAFAAESETHHAEMLSAVAFERQQLLAKASSDAAELTRVAEAAVATANVRFRLELERQAAILAGTMAQTLLSRLPPSSTTDAMFDALLATLRDLPEEERAKFVDEPLQVLTAAELAADARGRYHAAIEQILPKVGPITFEADPSLIAGFELTSERMQVRNSWKADLGHMVAALKEDGHDRAVG